MNLFYPGCIPLEKVNRRTRRPTGLTGGFEEGTGSTSATTIIIYDNRPQFCTHTPCMDPFDARQTSSNYLLEYIMFLTHKFHAILSTCRKPAISPNSILEYERLPLRLPWGENSVPHHHRRFGLCEHAATLEFRRPVPKAHRANQRCECFVPRVSSDSRMEHLRDIVNDMTTVEFTIRHHGSYLGHRRELIREDVNFPRIPYSTD